MRQSSHVQLFPISSLQRGKRKVSNRGRLHTAGHSNNTTTHIQRRETCALSPQSLFILDQLHIQTLIVNILGESVSSNKNWHTVGSGSALWAQAVCVSLCVWVRDHHCPSHICLPSPVLSQHTYLSIASCDCVKSLGIFFLHAAEKSRGKVSLVICDNTRVNGHGGAREILLL